MTYAFVERSWEEPSSVQSWHESEKLHGWEPISISSPPRAVEAADEAQ